MSRSFTVLLLAIALFGGVFALFRSRAGQSGNSLMIIAPYWYNGSWVFDDARAGLVREPFVGGTTELIDMMVRDIPNARDGFRMLFSSQPFPGYQKKFTWVNGDGTGNTYEIDDPPMRGWLCLALMKYFKQAPKELYVKAEPARS